MVCDSLKLREKQFRVYCFYFGGRFLFCSTLISQLKKNFNSPRWRFLVFCFHLPGCCLGNVELLGFLSMHFHLWPNDARERQKSHVGHMFMALRRRTGYSSNDSRFKWFTVQMSKTRLCTVRIFSFSKSKTQGRSEILGIVNSRDWWFKYGFGAGNVDPTQSSVILRRLRTDDVYLTYGLTLACEHCTGNGLLQPC